MKKTFKERLSEIIFEADTPAGKNFDIALLIFILISIALVMLESIPSVNRQYGTELRIAEWGITLIFSLEYLLRLWVVRKPIKYARSFFGIIDFLSVIPSYLTLFITGTHSLIVLRALRLLRVFRILKLTRYTSASKIILQALIASRTKISVFLFSVLILVINLGTIMYMLEGGANSGFTSIPRSIYWAIVTLTTVGYGDISPVTPAGQFLAGFVMILGYSIIAVPTGIVTVEFNRLEKAAQNTQICPNCLFEHHDDDAIYCKHCGTRLDH